MKAELPSILPPTRIILFALASFYCSYALSQEIDFQNSIDTSSEALITLDLKANDCLQALDSNDKPQATCNDFLSSLDGELISGYLEQCSLLKDWRDDYIDQSVASPPNADNGDNDEMLRRLIAIEYTCGENSLRSRTQFVVIAFNRLRSNSAISASPGTSATTISRQLNENRFNSLENRERERLQDAMRSQQDRSQRESNQQFNDLANELIRQQIQNSNRPN